jgi:hypothetical protein
VLQDLRIGRHPRENQPTDSAVRIVGHSGVLLGVGHGPAVAPRLFESTSVPSVVHTEKKIVETSSSTKTLNKPPTEIVIDYRVVVLSLLNEPQLSL